MSPELRAATVVATVYGWWQACEELNLPTHDPFTQNGANANLLIPNTDHDPLSASVAHRGQRCRVTKGPPKLSTR